MKTKIYNAILFSALLLLTGNFTKAQNFVANGSFENVTGGAMQGTWYWGGGAQRINGLPIIEGWYADCGTYSALPHVIGPGGSPDIFEVGASFTAYGLPSSNYHNNLNMPVGDNICIGLAAKTDTYFESYERQLVSPLGANLYTVSIDLAKSSKSLYQSTGFNTEIVLYNSQAGCNDPSSLTVLSEEYTHTQWVTYCATFEVFGKKAGYYDRIKVRHISKSGAQNSSSYAFINNVSLTYATLINPGFTAQVTCKGYNAYDIGLQAAVSGTNEEWEIYKSSNVSAPTNLVNAIYSSGVTPNSTIASIYPSTTNPFGGLINAKPGDQFVVIHRIADGCKGSIQQESRQLITIPCSTPDPAFTASINYLSTGRQIVVDPTGINSCDTEQFVYVTDGNNSLLYMEEIKLNYSEFQDNPFTLNYLFQFHHPLNVYHVVRNCDVTNHTIVHFPGAYPKAKQATNAGEFNSSVFAESGVENWKVFPTATSDVVTISFDGTNVDGKVKVISLMGNEVLSKSFSGTQKELDLSTLANGTYVLLIQSNKGQQYTQKIIKN